MMITSAQSSQDSWCAFSRIAQHQHCSASSGDPGQRIPLVFSRHANTWVDVDIMNVRGQRVHVEYQVGGEKCRKALLVHSEHLRFQSTTPLSSSEDGSMEQLVEGSGIPVSLYIEQGQAQSYARPDFCLPFELLAVACGYHDDIVGGVNAIVCEATELGLLSAIESTCRWHWALCFEQRKKLTAYLQMLRRFDGDVDRAKMQLLGMPVESPKASPKMPPSSMVPRKPVPKMPPKALRKGQVFQGSRNGLPPECNGDPRKYYAEMDYIWTILEREDVVLIRGSWLLKQSMSVSFSPLPCRQHLPMEARVDVVQLRELYAEGRHVIVAISHCWLSEHHPDPEGHLLKELATIIQSYDGEAAFFFAWCSLFQPFHMKHPDGNYRHMKDPQLTKEQEHAHAKALENMDIWYTHQLTQVWIFTMYFRGQGPPYDMRGWTTWEKTVASLSKPSHAVLEFFASCCHMNGCPFWDFEGSFCMRSRRPPVSVEDFEKDIEDKKFTCRGEDLPRIKENYTRNFKHALGSIREIHYDLYQLWSFCEHIVELFKALCHCTMLEEFTLMHYDCWRPVEASDACELGHGLMHCKKLRKLVFSGMEAIGEPCIRELCNTLQYCGDLQVLDLAYGHFGDNIAHDLAKNLRHCSHLQVLCLSNNNVGDTGAHDLAENLRHCSHLQVLELRNNIIGDTGAHDLAENLWHCSILQRLDLAGNKISDAFFQLVAEALVYDESSGTSTCTNLDDDEERLTNA